MAAKKRSTRSTPRRRSRSTRSAQTKTIDRHQGSPIDLKDAEVERALLTGERRAELEALFGESAYAELREMAQQAQRKKRRGGHRVLILPGIMGSKLGIPGGHLGLFDDTIWLDPVDLAAGNFKKLALDNGDNIDAVGVFLFTYLRIKLRLNMEGFDADFFAYDWRQSLDTLGERLASQIRAEVDKQGRPLSLVAHSMGGLVSRAALAELGGGEDAVRHVIMLGTPNYGSFSPVLALRGRHDLLNKVFGFDFIHETAALTTDVVHTLPGLYQMLPAPARFPSLDFFEPRSWPAGGPKPKAAILRRAPKVLEKLHPGDDRFSLIAGVNQETIVGASIVDDQFEFARSNAGDGTVPLAFAQLENVRSYFIEEEHGALPSNSQVRDAVVELIASGRQSTLTDSLPSMRGEHSSHFGERSIEIPAARAAEAVSPAEVREMLRPFMHAPLRSQADAPAAPQSNATPALSQERIVVARQRQYQVDVRLLHGSITQVDTRAVVLGHFAGVEPGGAAAALDAALDHVISEFGERRMLTGRVGEVFMMPAARRRIGAEMVVFCGLGDYDSFDSSALRLAAENVARTLSHTRVDDFATVVMGAGSGMTMRDALASLIEGFQRGMMDSQLPSSLRSITLCETDSTRYAQMRAELLNLATSKLFDEVELCIEELDPPPAPVPLARPSGRTTASAQESLVYLFVRETSSLAMDAPPLLRASLLTDGSRATVISAEHAPDGERLEELLTIVDELALEPGNIEAHGAELASIVLPELVREALASLRNSRLVVIHDAQTGRIPWEILNIDGWQPSLAKGLSRKYEAEGMAVAKWVNRRHISGQLNMLLIADPTEDLPGASDEGARLRELVASSGGINLTELWYSEATWRAVREQLASGEFDVVHYAGHAFFDPINRSRSGLLLSGNTVLSGADIGQLDKLPALVVFNACESGRVRQAPGVVDSASKAAEPARQHIDPNIGLAEALLRGGVANYVGTYWPVGDRPAKQFAKTFYEGLLAGDSIGFALNKGRGAISPARSVDWADYVHYGSPGFRLRGSS